MIPDSFIQDLIARIDIVELIDAHVPLKKAGANYAACCPFHSEKSPSFTVSPSKQFYHCFGCGAHGTAIGFLMEFAGLGFIEAVKDLAQRAGMQVPESRERDAAVTRTGPAATDLVDLMARATRYYREQLKQSPRAIDYLKRRGLSGETAAKFGIGYAPEGWQNLESAFDDYTSEALQLIGLVIRKENGRLYDRFRDRIMFPIINPKGEVIAFGGRVIDQGEPKYLNSPETPLFEKGRELFGFPQARSALRESDTAIVVEGYMDVVALAEHGISNALATLGTATTPEHVRKLLRQVDRIVFCFDGDNAGRKAAWRALENALDGASDNKMLAFAFLPNGDDPDSFVRRDGSDSFRSFIAEATPLSDYLIQELCRRSPPDSAEGRARLLHEAKPLLTRLNTPGLRLQIVKRLAELSQNTAREVERLCELRPVAAADAPAGRKRSPRTTPSLLRGIARLLVGNPAFASNLPDDLLPTEGDEARNLRDLRAACLDPQGSSPSTAALLERLRGTEAAPWVQSLYAELIASPLTDNLMQDEFTDAITRLKETRLEHSLRKLAARARAGPLSGDEKQQYLEMLQRKAAPGKPPPDHSPD